MKKFINNKIGAKALSGTVFRINPSYLDAEICRFFFVPVGGVFPVKVSKRSFSHFSTWWPQTDGPTDWRRTKPYRIACLQLKKQGRIHGYPSRMRVGRGSDEINQQGSWAGAVTPKPPINADKAKCYRRTDRPTDGPTDRQVFTY